MVVENSALPPFTTVKYTTKDGENCTATKDNGVVTVTGDKNGVRQMPVEEFMKTLAENLPKTNLEKTPAKDTVSFSGNNEQKKSSKSVVGWLTALGLAAIGAGVYYATKGKGGKEIVEKAGNTIKKGKDKVQNAFDAVTEKIKPKAEEKVADAVPVKPAQTKPVPEKAKEPKPTQEKPAPKKAKEPKPTQEKPAPKKAKEPKPVPQKTTPEKPAVIEQKANQNIEKLPLTESGTRAKAIESETDDLLKQAQKRAEEENKQVQDQLNNDLMAAAILLDDGWKTGGKQAAEAVEELLPKGEELIAKGEKALDDVVDLKPHTSNYDDIAELNPHTSAYDDVYKSADDYADITSPHLDGFSSSPHFDDYSSNSFLDDATGFMDDGFGF